MECDIGWKVHPPSQMKSGKAPPLTIPVRLGLKTLTAMLDTGSSVSLVRAHLIPSSIPILRYTNLAGVYRHVCRWPVVKVSLT